jgi:putative glutamine amidotransferase
MPDPKILVAGWPDRTEYYRPYLDAVGGPGPEVVLDLPPTSACASDAAIRDYLLPYGGILLPGGVDIEPRRYAALPHPNLGRVDPGLDEAQFALARVALAAELPIFGICRGLQILAVAVGGELYQDLPTEMPESMVRHDIKEPKDRLAHSVEFATDSRLGELSLRPRFKVNSRHHQAAKADPDASDRVGPFRVVARAPDGVIEGLEIPDRPFCIAVQWHPENLVASTQGSPERSKMLFAAFRFASGSR